MIRIVLFLVGTAVIALGAAWIADRPGEIVMTWQGWRISTTVTVAAAALLAAVVFAVTVWSLIRFVLRSPHRVAALIRERRKLRGWRTISRGLIAVGTGNVMLAKRSAGEARKLLGPEPLTLLLSAQAAQLGGETKTAEAEFRIMLDHKETRPLGLRGLYIEARRRSDAASALAFAEQAMRADPALTWAGEALIEFQCRAGDWIGALQVLERQIAAKAIGKAAGKRRRAVLIAAQALALEETDPGRARELATEAARLAPDLVPAAALAGRLHGAAGKLRKAARMIEKAWAVSPHPELAEVYAELRPGDTARDRLKRVKALVERTPGHIESLLAVARAALDAHDFGQARDRLAPLLGEPTQRACLLMAEIEATEHGDHGKAREWTARAVRARRDPAWVADGYVAERWLPASPLSGKLDAFGWSVPPSVVAGPVLEQVAEQVLAIAPSKPEPAQAPRKTLSIAEAPTSPKAAGSAPTRRAARPRVMVEPVVAEPPLPDDPGPEPELAPPRKRFRLLDWLAGPSP
ncbi:MAG: heme biosynthesis HemY N-terminal domain-containing protein [Xanthobacteraceae bacterium]|nr:heme biosynthesis HemY N-terminal domain-containing protein [Xanthobacteraceae bacterium]